MKIIICTCGHHILVDDEDYERIVGASLSCQGERVVGWLDNASRVLGRFLLNYQGPLEVDHEDRDYHNCTRSNLRLATRSQNMCNQLPRSNSSGLKGIRFEPERNRWRVSVSGSGRRVIKHCKTKEEAMNTHTQLVKELQGEFGYINTNI